MRVAAWIPALAIALAEWVLSDQPGLAITDGWLDLVLRKAAHVAVFALLTAAAWWALRRQGASAGAAVAGGAAIALIYAVVDEWHQSHVPLRSGAPADAAIDALGVGIAAMVLAMARCRPERP